MMRLLQWLTTGVFALAAGISGALPAAANTPAGVDVDDPLYKLGYLDVTKAPYNADPTGAKDSTRALNQAVRDARERMMVCYFPSGEYLISDTIYCMKTNKGVGGARPRDVPCVLAGSRKGARPVIRLASSAPGFGDPRKPKAAIWIWAMPQKPAEKAGSQRPEDEQANISFNQIFKGIDIDCGGNAGAIGIRHSGSQGSSLEDVTVRANGAFAGVYNCPGQGGGTYNLRVEGGRYGVYIENTRFPLLVGCEFMNQTETAIHKAVREPVLIIGCHIIRPGGTAIRLANKGGYGNTVIDTTIEMAGAGTAVDNAHAKSLYMKDVYVKGASVLVNQTAPWKADPKTWTHVAEYSYCDADSANLIDGQVNKSEIKRAETTAAPPPPDQLRARHLWDEKTFPSFEDADAFNVVTQGGARGDGEHDDADALQKAIDGHAKVFLPKGLYRISRTLHLRADTQLFGAGKTYSLICPSASWRDAPAPILSTVDDARARTTLAFLGIVYPMVPGWWTGVEWKAGKNSMVRDVYVTVTGEKATSPTHWEYAIRGNGGGRWYGVVTDENRVTWTSGAKDYRVILIEGTHEPLALYGVNVERSKTSPQMEIRGARNVTIYYLKTEAGTFGATGPDKGKSNRSTTLRIRNSRDVYVFACTGNVTLEKSMSIIEVEDSRNVTLTDVRPFIGKPGWFTLRETNNGKSQTIEAKTAVALFRRNGD